MKRGDLVTIAVSGHYGKPRPAMIVQADAFDLHPSVPDQYIVIATAADWKYFFYRAAFEVWDQRRHYANRRLLRNIPLIQRKRPSLTKTEELR